MELADWKEVNNQLVLFNADGLPKLPTFKVCTDFANRSYSSQIYFYSDHCEKPRKTANCALTFPKICVIIIYRSSEDVAIHNAALDKMS